MSGDQVFKRHRAMAGATASRNRPTRFAPYRKIVGEEPDGPYLDVEVLECGHRQRPREDMIGRTYPERRRCVACLTEACTAAGHPIIDWNNAKPRIGRPDLRCKCGRVKGDDGGDTGGSMSTDAGGR